MILPNRNQVPKQQNPKDLGEIKLLKTGRILEAINLIVNNALYYKGNYYESETTIAARLGISPITVSRAVKKARELGIIKRRRRFNKSNIYSVNPELRSPEIIDELAGVLPALRNLLCLSFLIPMSAVFYTAPARALPDFVKLYSKNVIFNNDNTISSVYTTKRYSTSSEFVTKREEPGSAKREEQLKIKKWQKEEELKGDMHNQAVDRCAFSCYNHVDTGSLCKEANLIIRKARTSQHSDITGKNMMQQLGERVANVLHVDIEQLCKETGHYTNNQTAREFKEFVKERLPRLKESIASLDMTADRKADVVERQLQVYRNRLHPDDCILLRNEGYPA